MLAALLTAAGPADAALFRYLAFGDSITFGSFDINERGYPPKLKSRLDAAGRPSRVLKRAVPGESTAAGLTRIDSVLAEGGQVLLLLEGTNDVFNRRISIETAHTNLAAMADKATAAGIDTVHITLIPMKKQGVNQPHNKNGQAGQLSAMIAATAAANDRWLVDLFDIWSAIPNLYRDYYYQGAEDPVGHPRHAGYQLMSQDIADVLLAPPPGAAGPTAPTGDVGTAAPAYEWTSASGATWYELAVQDAAGATVHRRWYKASDHCASPCSVTPVDALPAGGDYSWTVQPRNPGGLGPVSPAQTFTYWAAPPVAATGSTPSGPTFATDPVFTWSEVADATAYRLEVEDGVGTVYDAAYAAASVCAAGLCSTSPALGLATGDHSWRVTASNPAGSAPASPDLAFEVRACAAGDQTIGPGTISGSELHEFCGTITLTGLTVETGADATFHAGVAVVIAADTVFEQDSTVIVRTE